MKMMSIALILVIVLCGCIAEPKLESTKPWESHYYTVEELKKAIDSIKLDKDESIWMMNNHTLNRLLKNVGK